MQVMDFIQGQNGMNPGSAPIQERIGEAGNVVKRKKAVLLRQPLGIESKIVISLIVTALKPRGRTSLQGKPSQLAALPLR